MFVSPGDRAGRARIASTTPTIASSGFTLPVNSAASMTMTDTSTGVLFQDTSPSGQVRGFVKPYPGSKFTLSLCLTMPANAANNDRLGIIVMNTLTGQLLQLNIHFTGTATDYNVLSWNSPTSFNAVVVANTLVEPGSFNYLWLRYQDDGTNMIYSVSTDNNYYPAALYTVSKSASFLGSSGFNYIGFGCNATSRIGSTLIGLSQTFP